MIYDNKMKKVSIVVPLYKSEAFLPKLIDSVLAQTYTNFELILVDDESPDNSGKISEEYALRDSRIKVIHKKNGGCCDARNKGLEAATGEYLMFADGDDWLESDCVEYLVDLMEKNDCEMATTDAVFTTRNRIQNDTDKVRIASKEETMADILYANIPLGGGIKSTQRALSENIICALTSHGLERDSTSLSWLLNIPTRRQLDIVKFIITG